MCQQIRIIFSSNYQLIQITSLPFQLRVFVIVTSEGCVLRSVHLPDKPLGGCARRYSRAIGLWL